jgi:hypothetical protein
VGSLLSLDPELHVYFARLADRYGPIFSIRLGSKLVVVVTSASLAREVLREQDLARMQEGKSLRDGGELVTGNAADPLVDRQREFAVWLRDRGVDVDRGQGGVQGVPRRARLRLRLTNGFVRVHPSEPVRQYRNDSGWIGAVADSVARFAAPNVQKLLC